MKWRADAIQASIFTVPGQPQMEALDIWPILRPGERPDNFQRGQPGPGGVTVASGQREGVVLVVTSHIGRIDILAHGMEQNNSSAPPQIEDIQGVLARQKAYADKLLDHVPCVRLAFNVNTSILHDSSERMALFSEVTNNQCSFPPESRDLIYQYNQQFQMEEADGIVLNRVVTYSSGEHQFIPVSPFGVVVSPKNSPFIAKNYDFNTGFFNLPNSAVVKSLLNLLHVSIFDEIFGNQ